MSSVQLDDEKPFWQNPALILAVVPALLGVLRIFGVISEDQVGTVNELIRNLVENGLLFTTSIVAIVHWFKQDTTIKVEKLAMKRELMVQQLRMGLKQE
jgi:hypothetical protein